MYIYIKKNIIKIIIIIFLFLFDIYNFFGYYNLLKNIYYYLTLDIYLII